MRRRVVAAAALALGLAAPPSRSAPMGPGVEAAAVLLLEADLGNDVAAKSLTNALRQRVLDSDELTLNGQSPPLVAAAHEAKCPLKGLKYPPSPADERAFDDACLRRVAARVGAKRLFWGHVYAEGGKTLARVHFWQEGRPDRAAALPYDAAARDRVADRLYRKLVTPDKVGDVTVSGLGEGELFVGERSAGAYVAGAELTLPVGEHELEVRQGPRVVARSRAVVTAGGRVEARLESVAAPAPPAPTHPFVESPPIKVRPRPTAWPWVLGGATAAGVAGAGALWAARGAAKGDAERSCSSGVCPEGARDDVERADRYGALAGVSLGVGLAAGAGLATYLLLAKREPKVVGAAVPVAGGAVLSIGGRF